jgi:hypothetical protein
LLPFPRRICNACFFPPLCCPTLAFISILIDIVSLLFGFAPSDVAVAAVTFAAVSSSISLSHIASPFLTPNSLRSLLCLS